MRKLTTIAIVFLIKAAIFYMLIEFGITRFDAQKSLFNQHILVWLLVYLPMAMGLESFISILVPKKQKD